MVGGEVTLPVAGPEIASSVSFALSAHADAPAMVVGFSSDGKTVAAMGPGDGVRFYDSETLLLQEHVECPNAGAPLGSTWDAGDAGVGNDLGREAVRERVLWRLV